MIGEVVIIAQRLSGVESTPDGRVRVTLAGVVDQPPPAPKPSTGIPTDGQYLTVSQYATHRGVCEKTIRNLLPHLPHSTIGGIRIRMPEADQAFDSLKKPPRGRRKANSWMKNLSTKPNSSSQ